MELEGRSNGGEEQKTYRMEFPKGGAKECLVEGCPGRAGTSTAAPCRNPLNARSIFGVTTHVSAPNSSTCCTPP